MKRTTQLIGSQHAARLLGVSVATVRVWARAGQLPVAGVLPTGQRVFQLAAVERAARERRLVAQEGA